MIAIERRRGLPLSSRWWYLKLPIVKMESLISASVVGSRKGNNLSKLASQYSSHRCRVGIWRGLQTR